MTSAAQEIWRRRRHSADPPLSVDALAACCRAAAASRPAARNMQPMPCWNTASGAAQRWRFAGFCAATRGAGMAMTRCPIAATVPRGAIERHGDALRWKTTRNMWLFMGISAGIILLFWVVLPRFFPAYFASPEMVSSSPPAAQQWRGWDQRTAAGTGSTRRGRVQGTAGSAERQPAHRHQFRSPDGQHFAGGRARRRSDPGELSRDRGTQQSADRPAESAGHEKCLLRRFRLACRRWIEAQTARPRYTLVRDQRDADARPSCDPDLG